MYTWNTFYNSELFRTCNILNRWNTYIIIHGKRAIIQDFCTRRIVLPFPWSWAGLPVRHWRPAGDIETTFQEYSCHLHRGKAQLTRWAEGGTLGPAVLKVGTGEVPTCDAVTLMLPRETSWVSGDEKVGLPNTLTRNLYDISQNIR